MSMIHLTKDIYITQFMGPINTERDAGLNNLLEYVRGYTK
jgi:hypothetical protein